MKNSKLDSTPGPDKQLDRVFHALSDQTRRAIINRLSKSSATVSTLAEPFDMSLNAVSKHLKTLESAELIQRKLIGRTSVCSLNADALNNATEWIHRYAQFWEEVLDSFEEHMENKVKNVTDLKPDKDK